MPGTPLIPKGHGMGRSKRKLLLYWSAWPLPAVPYGLPLIPPAWLGKRQRARRRWPKMAPVPD